MLNTIIKEWGGGDSLENEHGVILSFYNINSKVCAAQKKTLQQKIIFPK
jgi:hypothetical protein